MGCFQSSERFKDLYLQDLLRDFDHILNNKKEVIQKSALDNKIVGLYFSMTKCSTCKQFTPLLIQSYFDLLDTGADFEVVTVPCDSRKPAANHSYNTRTPWYTVPFDRQHINSIGVQLELCELPVLVLFNYDGSFLALNGIERVRYEGADAFPFGSKQLPLKPLTEVISGYPAVNLDLPPAQQKEGGAGPSSDGMPNEMRNNTNMNHGNAHHPYDSHNKNRHDNIHNNILNHNHNHNHDQNHNYNNNNNQMFGNGMNNNMNNNKNHTFSHGMNNMNMNTNGHHGGNAHMFALQGNASGFNSNSHNSNINANFMNVHDVNTQADSRSGDHQQYNRTNNGNQMNQMTQSLNSNPNMNPMNQMSQMNVNNMPPASSPIISSLGGNIGLNLNMKNNPGLALYKSNANSTSSTSSQASDENMNMSSIYAEVALSPKDIEEESSESSRNSVGGGGSSDEQHVRKMAPHVDDGQSFPDSPSSKSSVFQSRSSSSTTSFVDEDSTSVCSTSACSFSPDTSPSRKAHKPAQRAPNK